MEISQPTDEQKSIINYDGNIAITARPGSGKTYTLVEKMAVLLPLLPDYKGVIAISFTNKASNELMLRCRQRNILTKMSFFGTIDKFYLSQIIIPFSSHITGNMPEYRIVDTELESRYLPLSNFDNSFSEEKEYLLVEILREGKIPLSIIGQIALFLLKRTSGAIKYLKARFSHIIIDEYQDCGSAQHSVFLYLVENGIKGIAVGDIHQAIYRFANRFPTYLVSLLNRNDFRQFELSKNHRCHSSISEYSLCLMGVARDIPSEKRVFKVSISGGDAEIADKIDSYIERIKLKYEVSTNNQIAILCHSNRSVHRIGSLLKTQHKAFEETLLDKDSSDWGRLFRDILYAAFEPDTFAIDFVSQLISEDLEPTKFSSAVSLCKIIFQYLLNEPISAKKNLIEFAKLIYPQKESSLSVRLLDDILSNQAALSTFIPALDNQVNILTLHKSKGLEFEIVFHLDMYKWVIPNEYGTKENQIQDLNLHYVGITRAKKACYIIIGTMRCNSRDEIIRAEASPFLLKPGLHERRKDVCWD